MADTAETPTVHTVEVVRYDDPVIVTERVAVSAFIAGYVDSTRRSYATDLRIFVPGVTTMASDCRTSSDPISRRSPKTSSTRTPHSTSGVPRRTTSHAHSAWTATNSEPIGSTKVRRFSCGGGVIFEVRTTRLRSQRRAGGRCHNSRRAPAVRGATDVAHETSQTTPWNQSSSWRNQWIEYSLRRCSSQARQLPEWHDDPQTFSTRSTRSHALDLERVV